MDPSQISANTLTPFEMWLSDGEKQHLATLVNPNRIHEYRLSRLLLRSLLAERLNCFPQEVIFKQTDHGRMELANHRLSFNLSHSDNTLAIAIGRQYAIGVDVECRTRTRDPLSIAQRFFAPEEISQLEQCRGSARMKLFYRLWTLKEALLKSEGRGIGAGLHRIAFCLEPKFRFENRLDHHTYHLAQWRLDKGWLAACQRDERPQWQLYHIKPDLKPSPLHLQPLV